MKGTGPLNALEITSAREVGACNSSCQLFQTFGRRGSNWQLQHRSLIFGGQGPYCPLGSQELCKLLQEHMYGCLGVGRCNHNLIFITISFFLTNLCLLYLLISNTGLLTATTMMQICQFIPVMLSIFALHMLLLCLKLIHDWVGFCQLFLYYYYYDISLLSLPVPFALQSIVIYINMAVLVQQNALLAHLYECLPISLHHYLHRLLACKKVCQMVALMETQYPSCPGLCREFPLSSFHDCATPCLIHCDLIALPVSQRF